MAQGGRPRSLDNEELEGRMYDTADELLARAGGVGLTLEHVNFEQVIGLSDVGRSAAYRVFPSKTVFTNKWALHLAAPLGGQAAAFDQETVDTALRITLKRAAELGTRAGRERVLMEVVKEGAHRNFVALSTDPTWRTYSSLIMTTGAIQDEAQRASLMSALVASEQAFIDRMSFFYAGMAAAFRLAPRPPFTAENMFAVLAKVGGAIVEGLALHALVDDSIKADTYDHFGEQWSIASLGFKAVLLMVTKFDEDPATEASGELTPTQVDTLTFLATLEDPESDSLELQD